MKNASFSVDDVVYSFFSLDRIQHFCPQLCLFALQPHTKKDKKSLLFRSWSSTKAQNVAQKEFLMLEKFHIFRDIRPLSAEQKSLFRTEKCIFNIISHTE